ncbi:MAG: NAD(P)-dependent oxidoreductase, partial [Candidatus Zixiibacteriota bacterium]
MPDRMLIIGGTGLLGVDLTKFFSSSYKVCSVGHREMDITNMDQVKKFFENFQPHFVLHAAAIADVDKCEIYQDLAMSVNADGTENIVRACHEHDAFLVYYSTDYVFDGKKGRSYEESDKTGPINFYGRTKLEGESRVMEYPDMAAILRVAWLYGSSDRSFIYRLIQSGLKQAGDRASGLKGEEIKIVADQISTPTWTWDVARQTEVILRAGLTGLFHCTAEGQATRKE